MSKVEMKRNKTCKGCKWHDEFTWVCCNGYSENCADFVNEGCELYEKEKNETIRRHPGNKIPD